MGGSETFTEFEHRRWQEAADTYERTFAELTAQTAPHLLAALGAGEGKRLLDIACGGGGFLACAARTGVKCTGVDFSDAMIEHARGRFPGLDFQQGDAEALAYGDGTFDCVSMNFGILHLENPERALREIHRVLVPGGVMAFTVWAQPEEARGFQIVREALERFGDPATSLPAGPPFFQFSDPGETRRALTECGFVEFQNLKLDMTWRLPDSKTFFEAFLYGTARTGGILAAQTPEKLARVRKEIEERVCEWRSGEEICLPMPAMLYSARK
jgi:SAM-dependent methyltransferase